MPGIQMGKAASAAMRKAPAFGLSPLTVAENKSAEHLCRLCCCPCCVAQEAERCLSPRIAGQTDDHAASDPVAAVAVCSWLHCRCVVTPLLLQRPGGAKDGSSVCKTPAVEVKRQRIAATSSSSAATGSVHPARRLVRWKPTRRHHVLLSALYRSGQHR